jgi:phosphate transport system protein
MPRKALDSEMEKIRRDILEMSDLVSNAMSKSITVLEKKDKKLAEEVCIEDGLINEYETYIKRRSIQTIALQQPVAKDLRFISISLDVAYNLERIGDYAKDIAESLQYMNDGYFLLDEIPEMGKLAGQMIGDAVNAFTNEDMQKVDSVLKMEERVDEIYKSIFPILKSTVREKCDKCPTALNLILIGKFIERIADHSVNIAKRAMYKISGEVEYL